MNKEYLDIVYSRRSKPLTNYPEKLVDFIIKKANLNIGSYQTIFEPGVGLGDHLRIFKDKGFNVRGADISYKSKEFSNDLDIDVMDSDGKAFPYKNETFDIVYSKSFIEHLDDPEFYLNEAYRILKPGGKIITLTPDWVANHKKFYDDYTHKSPFSKVSLKNIKLACGFNDVNSFTFRQLPSTWNNPLIDKFCACLSPFIPYNTNIKFFRWSRELMLMSYAKKPI